MTKGFGHKLRCAVMTVALVASPLLFSPTAVDAQTPAAPAAAQAPLAAQPCTGSNYGSGGLIRCSVTNPNGGGRQRVPGWTILRSYATPCTDGNGRPSFRADLVQEGTGAVLADQCALQRGGAGTNLIDQRDLGIDNPAPTADFEGDFLVGAQIQFQAPQLQNYAQTLQLFPGATIVANPVKMEWDFGDGSKSTELAPKHTFKTKSPNPTNPNDHKVRVVLTGTWNLYLHPADGGLVQDLGEVSLTGQLERPIVEVWSAPTEPK